MNLLTPNVTFLYLLKTYVFSGYRKVTLDVNGLGEVRNFVSSGLGFPTLRRNLQENRLSLENETLDSILTIKINMPVLWKVFSNATETTIIWSIEKYYAQKNWRWEQWPLTISNDSQKHVCTSTVNPPKKACLQDMADSDAHSSSCEESDFSGNDADSYNEL